MSQSALRLVDKDTMDKQKALDAWQAFDNDPKWQKLIIEYGLDVAILSQVKSEFFDPTHYSPMK